MKTKLLYLVIVCLVCSKSVMFAQLHFEGGIIDPSTQIWSFMKYGNTPVNLYSGTATVSVPIYTYKDKDFELPLSIDYASNGYRPGNPAGPVGLGWFINFGGYITREIRGLNDEDIGNYRVMGFWHRYNEAGPNAYDDILSNGEHTYIVDGPEHTWTMPYKPFRIETEPDLFTFKFFQHSGNFIMQPNQCVAVFNTQQPRGEYRVDTGKLTSGSKITITTGDGYVYTFKNDEDNNKIKTYKSGTYPNYVSNYMLVPLAWPLTQIEAPNGRKVIFEYGPIEFSDKCYPTETIFAETNPKLVPGRRIIREYIKQISKIIIDDFYIEFLYGERQQEKIMDINLIETFEKNVIPEKLEIPRKLNSIKIKHNNKILKECSMEYGYTPRVNALYLKKINIPSEGDGYSMSYYEGLYYAYSLPLHGEVGVDYWGFSNGRASINPGDLFPGYTLDDNNVEHIEKPLTRNPSFYSAVSCMLTGITYPTKGYTKFYYEPHQYSKRLTKDLTHNNQYYLKQESALAGGVRIQKIVDYTSDSDSTYREFSYNYIALDGEVGESSGILLHFPRYGITYDATSLSVKDGKIYSGSNTHKSCVGILPQVLDKNHIAYSEVAESLPGGGYIHYKYSDYVKVPDEPYVSSNKKETLRILNSTIGYLDAFFSEPNSLAAQRGRLECKSIYNKFNTRLYTEEYIYDYTKPLSYHESGKIAEGYFGYIYRTYLDDYPLIKKITTSNMSNVSIEQVERYDYNRLGQLIKTETSTSGGSTICAETKFIADIDFSNSPDVTYMDFMIGRMSAHNVLKNPIYEQVSIIGRNGIKYITSGKYNRYSCLNYYDPAYKDIILLQSKLKLNLTKPSIIPDFDYDDLLQTDLEYIYDRAGNIIRLTRGDGVSICYIWGYGGKYIVAKIDNAPAIPTIEAISGLENISFAPLVSNLADANVDMTALRNLSNSTVTIYEHIPYVGVTKIIDASGKETTYDYDDYNRLSVVRNDKNNIVNQYQYKIKKQ